MRLFLFHIIVLYHSNKIFMHTYLYKCEEFSERRYAELGEMAKPNTAHVK